jgi:hypothetical protein
MLGKEAMQGYPASAVPDEMPNLMWLVQPLWLEGSFSLQSISRRFSAFKPRRKKESAFSFEYFAKGCHTFVTSYPCWLCRLLTRARVSPVQLTEKDFS